jgi:hypothetical protein
MNVRAQAFILDYLSSIVLFLIILSVAIVLIIDIVPDASYEELYRENNYLSAKLLEPGFPLNWTSGDVLVPGFASNHRVNDTKLSQFDALSYPQKKTTLQLSGDFLIYFRTSTEIIRYNGVCTYGYIMVINATTCEPDFSTITYDNLIRNQRLVLLNGTPTFMEVYSWS